jgi:NAD(P)-dependent dehydrogenase (short-subunit alcohol dehydrogenase family)
VPNHPALAANRVAVVTGAASGIGLAASAKFAALGMKVCMADLSGDALEPGAAKVRAVAAKPDLCGASRSTSAASMTSGACKPR